VKGAGETSGIIPFIRVMDADAGDQPGVAAARFGGGLSRYPPSGIEEFLEIRKASGDFNRKGLNLHHGINVTDEFMAAVRDGGMFGLKSPKDGAVLRQVDARQLWQRILETRLQTGEPYLLYHRYGESCPAEAPAEAGA
jgi:ribonucleoside-diphosphate reductase alpha chain